MAAAGIGMIVCLLITMARKSATMSNCETKSAICTFNERLRGSILFQERHGFGCSSFGGVEGLHVQINVQGFDPGDSVTAHTFRIKSYAGLRPNCSSMGPDYGQGVRSSDLGTFPENGGGVVYVPDADVKNGPTLATGQSIIGRSVAVIKGKGSQNNFQHEPEITLGCCIIGVANFDSNDNNAVATSGFQTPSRASPFRNNNNNINNNNINNNPFGASPVTSFNNNNNREGFRNNRYNPDVRRQSVGNRPSPQGLANTFTSSGFRSPFGLGDRFFFDLSGKGSNVDKVLPASIKKKFEPPTAPRFQDIYGLDSGDSPLGRSGNTVAPNKGNSFSKMFFKGDDIASTVNVGLSAEEMDIPRESSDEESSQAYHEDKNVDKDPRYKDAPEGPETSEGDVPPVGSYDTPQPIGNSDVGKASFLESKLKNLDNSNKGDIDVSESYHNGKAVTEDESDPSPPDAAEGAGGSDAPGPNDVPAPSDVPSARDPAPQASDAGLPPAADAVPSTGVEAAAPQEAASSVGDDSQAPDPHALPASSSSSSA